MFRKYLPLALGCVAAILCLPVGFAIAQATLSQPEIATVETHEDPDPSTDPQQEMKALEQASAEGNPIAKEKAIEAVREEILSRLPQSEREASESAPPALPEPPGTKTYLAPVVPDAIASHCEETLAEGADDPFCEMLVLRAEGKIRSGAFTASEQAAILTDHRSDLNVKGK